MSSFVFIYLETWCQCVSMRWNLNFCVALTQRDSCLMHAFPVGYAKDVETCHHRRQHGFWNSQMVPPSFMTSAAGGG